LDESYEFCWSCPIVGYLARIATEDVYRPEKNLVENLAQLILTALQKFNSSTIHNSHSKSFVDKKVLEAVWAMEFYRATCMCLDSGTFISPQVVSGRAEGWVDFVINSNKWWLVELLREGLGLGLG